MMTCGTPSKKTVSHAPGFRPSRSVTTVEATEALLSEWFEAPVVLTSSGRSAMLLYLTATGHSRYQHRVALPRMISACVVEAVIRRAFPLDAAMPGAADTTILYHQYGLPQLARPAGRVLEDICHALFASPTTGARTWAGEAAVFSLPKFFSTATMVGGLVVPDPRLATELRALRESAPPPHAPRRAEHAAILGAVGHSGGPDLEVVYLERLTNPRLLDSELGGVPASLADIGSVAAHRADFATRVFAAMPPDALPEGWSTWLPQALPFAFPVFGTRDRLETINSALAGIGISAGIYQIDIARDIARPNYAAALLVPCHQAIGVETQRTIVRCLAETEQQ
jgi:hypothetical protein